MANGIFSVDPFTKGDLGGVANLPGLSWGFDVTTCFVTKKQAAAAYYSLTDTEKRIFAPAVQGAFACRPSIQLRGSSVQRGHLCQCQWL